MYKTGEGGVDSSKYLARRLAQRSKGKCSHVWAQQHCRHLLLYVLVRCDAAEEDLGCIQEVKGQHIHRQGQALEGQHGGQQGSALDLWHRHIGHLLLEVLGSVQPIALARAGAPSPASPLYSLHPAVTMLLQSDHWCLLLLWPRQPTAFPAGCSLPG